MKVPVPEECTRSAGHISPERVQTQVELAFTPPFDSDAVLGNLRAHAIAGAEVVEGDTITRLIGAPSGPVVVAATLTPDAVSATIGSANEADVAAVTTIIRRWFDLDLDPAAVVGALGADPVIGPLVSARPGLRVVGSPNGFETAIMAVLGQQVSLARARALGAMLVDAFGEPGPAGLRHSPTAGTLASIPVDEPGPAALRVDEPGPAALRLFPTAETLASVPVDELRAALRLTGMRALALHGLAAACASGLELSPRADPAQIRERLLALAGIGPWTADYLAVRVLGDRDAFTAGDLVLKRALGRVSTREAEAASQAWRPYRAYALFHLWTATSY